MPYFKHKIFVVLNQHFSTESRLQFVVPDRVVRAWEYTGVCLYSALRSGVGHIGVGEAVLTTEKINLIVGILMNSHAFVNTHTNKCFACVNEILIILLTFGQTCLGKQCKTRSDCS